MAWRMEDCGQRKRIVTQRNVERCSSHASGPHRWVIVSMLFCSSRPGIDSSVAYEVDKALLMSVMVNLRKRASFEPGSTSRGESSPLNRLGKREEAAASMDFV